ncbi:Serine-threonine/tyrosine-protein kinase, catalytic domain [Dillenia turbinata]|uniref:Serine-threonine/tyrosine-protein kinase, catalytic domain n=1 Tax=Dillenia turbinata TaxID=194707 RepID=A0AAN8YYH0_9MAGN
MALVASAAIFILITSTITASNSASVIDDLNNLHPPQDFAQTIKHNCEMIPSLRYCNASPSDLTEIFKSTIVASHLCNESKNPNCVQTFTKIDLRDRPKIAPLYLSFSFFWKYCPLTIIDIDLSNNSLKGGFPTDVLKCSQIQALDLSHNELSGYFPFQDFSPLTNLTHLNLSYNHFSECKISNTHFFKRFKPSSFVHSGLIPNQGKFTLKALILLIGFPVLVILVVGFFWWLCFKRPDYLPASLRSDHKFTVSMIEAATHDFSTKHLVGKFEGFDIYKGVLRNGSEVRIEIYWDKISNYSRRKFVEECSDLVRLSHRNLVRVLGWCNNGKLRAIVSEWNEGESVETWLLDSNPSWKRRLKVLVGVLEGMCYVEEERPQIGYDLRTRSVLVSEDGEPLISRFKFGDQHSIMKKIYKFGIFLLEMVSNKRPREEFQSGEAGFLEWVKMHYPGSVRKVIDERMKLTGRPFEQASQGVGLGLMCTDLSAGMQPGLSQIANVIRKVYQSHLVSTSLNHNRLPGIDKGEGHQRMQTK